MVIVKRFTLVFFSLLVVSILTLQQVNAIRIVAVVGGKAITDYDVENLGNMLCKIDKRTKCGSMENTQMSMMTIVDTYLKLEHYKQSKIDLSNFTNGFEKYKEKVLENFKIKKNAIPEQFNDYLFAEFVWNIMLSSQMKDRKITDAEIKNFAIGKNIKITDKNEEMIKNEILQEEYNKQSMKMISELKKIYFIDIKG